MSRIYFGMVTAWLAYCQNRTTQNALLIPVLQTFSSSYKKEKKRKIGVHEIRGKIYYNNTPFTHVQDKYAIYVNYPTLFTHKDTN